MDLIDRQAAIDAVSYAMKNGGDWRPVLEAVPSMDPLEAYIRERVEKILDDLVEVTAQCKLVGENVPEILYCSALSDDEVKQPCIEGPCGFECEKEDNNGQL